MDELQAYNYDDNEVLVVPGASLMVHFEPARNKTVMGTYVAHGQNSTIVFWGENNALPEEREYLIGNNSMAPQIIRTKRDLILGGGLMAYTEHYELKQGKAIRVIDEVPIEAQFQDWIAANEEAYGDIDQLADDLLKHGNYYAECGINGDGSPAYIKPQPARHVRAQKQEPDGRIPRYWLYGAWSKVASQQRLQEVKGLMGVDAYTPGVPQAKFLMHGADKLLGGPYYYDPHYAGSTNWLKVANAIPVFHLSNLENGFNIRYLIKVPEDYFLRSLSEQKRKDTENLGVHLKQAKDNFKKRLNEFLAGVKNAGRGLIVTKHIYKHLQREWPELEIVPLEVDLKDEAMLKLYEASNNASTSAHGIPPVLAGLATGAKMTSGSEVRNLFNFWQTSAAPMPRKILLKPYRWAWRTMGMPKEVKLGFRNIELQTTDKSPSGITETPPEDNTSTE